ncbi:putative membrane protein [Escherichia coli 99.0672]|nr:putative membrane protein [Escherichia coli DEC8D]EHW41647.1 putative membrane protein [Escherichia coli DEC9A]EHW71075.1 putative membrane protein [Escherichia coli DEC10B]EHW94559.1 putative membrane protein [Escherichia coli DEC10F]EKW89341.1 putative membrane protein [Escherichia coli 99.0672]KDT53581.1 putative membrane protein [Escherichia coli 3-267-03_S1_C3]KDU08261.1 putative membrane protein [Escherichia coli 3-267-03_S1_C1]
MLPQKIIKQGDYFCLLFSFFCVLFYCFCVVCFLLLFH